MRPYIALIKDSFRAAISSKVLYILLLLIALLLIALAPLHMRETLDWKLIFMENVKKPDVLARKLVESREDEKPVARIWDLLSSDFQKKLERFQDANQSGDDSEESADDANEDSELTEDEATKSEETGDVADASQGADNKNTKESARVRRQKRRTGDQVMVYQMALLPKLNEVIENRDFYRAEDWEDTSLGDEAKELIEIGPEKLSDERSKRLNRLLLARALSPTIDEGDTALEFFYGPWKWDVFTTSLTHQQFAQSLTSTLPRMFDKFVLSIGLFIAILVTANMIPETFEPGSLNLLLSKPISRSGMYLSKFLGGCVFILLCSAFLFLGIWLWLGLAMGVWDRAILYSIPLYVIVFAIYFSVSAFVGLLWRSPIAAVVITLLFWATCFLVGSVHGFFATRMANTAFVNVLPAKDKAYPVDLLQQLKVWDSSKQEWQSKLGSNLGDEAKIQYEVNSWMIPGLKNIPAIPGIDQRLAPVYDAKAGKLYAVKSTVGKFSRTRNLLVSDVEALEFKPVGNLPKDTSELAATSLGLVAVDEDGRFYLLADSEEDLTDEVPAEGEPSQQKQQFLEAGPKRKVSVRDEHAVDFNHALQQFAIYRRGRVTFYAIEDGKFQKKEVMTPELDFKKRMSCQVAFQGNSVLLAFGNGKVMEFDATTQEKIEEHQPETRSAIESIAGSPNGKFFAILYRNGNVWVMNKEANGQFKAADLAGQGKAHAIAFGENSRLWIVENTDRAIAYDVATGASGERIAPAGSWIEKTYRYGVEPLYRIFPKPGEFYKVVTHLSSSGDTEENLDIDLRQQPSEYSDPWSPLWSGLGFMFAMLFIACTVFHFKDF